MRIFHVTFPVRFPLLRLDRIYVKNAHASSPTALALLNWRHDKSYRRFPAA
jgi:endonuclease/exonuclease/phosphatase family metal-dependent hydrolase